MRSPYIQAKFYHNLAEQGTFPKGNIPKTLLKSDLFASLLASNILQERPKGRGHIVAIHRLEEYKAFLDKYFPNGDPTSKPRPKNAVESSALFGDSKAARGRTETPMVFFRGDHPIHLNGKTVDLAYYTRHFGVLAAVLQELCTPKVCFVENKEPFLRAEAVMPKGYVFVHAYGRIGPDLLRKMNVEEILVFSDYDYKGLEEYLKCKQHCAETTFYMPPDTVYAALFKRYAKPLRKAGKGSQQKPSYAVQVSQDPLVRQLCHQLATTHRFLEQEAVFHHAL